MTKRSKIDELVAALQSEMSRVGGKLAGLSSEQNWAKSRNNNIDGEHTPQEGTNIIMANAAKNIVSENNNDESKSSLPPAGGAHEQEIAANVVNYLTQMGVVKAPSAQRSWKEKALDQAIPTAVTVATVLAVQGTIALVSHGVNKYQEKKKLAAEQKALLSAPVGDLSNVG